MASSKRKPPSRLSRKPATKSAGDALVNTVIEIVADVAYRVFRKWWDSPSKPTPAASANSYQSQTDAAPPKRRQKRQPAWWKVLQIPEDATREQIQRAYRDLMGRCHPDRVAHLSPQLKKVAEREAKKLNVARDTALEDNDRPDK